MYVMYRKMYAWIVAAQSVITVLFQIENSKFCRPDILKKLSEAIDNAQVLPTCICVYSTCPLLCIFCIHWYL